MTLHWPILSGVRQARPGLPSRPDSASTQCRSSQRARSCPISRQSFEVAPVLPNRGRKRIDQPHHRHHSGADFWQPGSLDLLCLRPRPWSGDHREPQAKPSLCTCRCNSATVRVPAVSQGLIRSRWFSARDSPVRQILVPGIRPTARSAALRATTKANLTNDAVKGLGRPGSRRDFRGSAPTDATASTIVPLMRRTPG